MESLSRALDETSRELTAALSSRDELTQRCAVLEERAANSELATDKLNNELELERDQTRKLWERDNETQNRWGTPREYRVVWAGALWKGGWRDCGKGPRSL